MKKKTVLIETKKAGRNWTIAVSAQGEDLFQLFGSIVRKFAGDKELTMINGSDPFSSAPKRKKKPNRVPAVDKPAA